METQRQERGKTIIPPFKLYWVFSGNNVKTMDEKKKIIVTNTFVIDPSKSPKTMDYIIAASGDSKTRTLLEIYELKGDNLRICGGIGDEPEKRPTTFSDTDKNLFIISLKRVKDGELAEWLHAFSDQGPLYAGKPASFWLNQIQDTNAKYRSEAVEALGNIAKKNTELIPVLVASFKDNETYDGRFSNSSAADEAARALGALGPVAVPALAKALEDGTSPKVAIHAARALSIIGPEAKAAVPALMKVLKKENIDVRHAAIYALWHIGPDAQPAVPVMIDILGEYLKSESVPQLAQSRGIGKRTTRWEAGSFMSELSRALSRIDPEFKEIVTIPGPKTGPGGPGGFSGPGKKGDGTEQQLMNQWQKAYEELRKKYPAQSPIPYEPEISPKQGTGKTTDSEHPLYRGKPASYWLDQFKDSDPKFRAEAVTALGSIAQKNKDVIPVLVEALADKDYAVGSQAVAALGSLGSEIVPVILDVLKNPKSPTAYTNAAKVVGKIGAPAKDAVPFLERGLKVDATDGPDQRAIILALGRIGPDAKPAIPALVEMLGHYLESVKDIPKQGKIGQGIGTGPLASPTSWPRKVLEAVQQIDPDVKEVLPERINNGTAFMGGAQNWMQLKEMWDQTYVALKKRYAK